MKKISEAKMDIYRQESAEELYNFIKNHLERNYPKVWNEIYHLILQDFRKDIEEIKDAINREQRGGST